MSNVLKVNEQQVIRSLFEKGWSQRRIAAELGIHRSTVRRYASNCSWQVTVGTVSEAESKCTISTSGSGELGREQTTSGNGPGRRSQCERFAATIAGKLDAGLSAQRIWQDLVEENAFEGSYQSVKRFVHRFKQRDSARVWRMECQPGEEMQVDFGLGAPIECESGKTRRSWVFRTVLSYSRKGYSEAVLRQDTETFLRCLENALRHYGGVPMLLNLDNLKAAVLKADWFDPEINPKLEDFCRHYGLHVTPCRPATPQHKGKVERGVAYLRDNALRGRRFKSPGQENAFLARWEENVADKRIHGTTCKQVAASFDQERPHLQPLPDSLFPCYREARRTVNRDSFVEVERAFYEAPPEYIGRQIWVRWDSRCVRLFNERMEQVQLHTRIEAGRFSRVPGAGGMSAPVLSSCRWWVERAALIGEQCGRWAQEALDVRGIEALRAIMGLCRLAGKHTAAALNDACARALNSGTPRLKDIRRLLAAPPTQQNFAFAENHPLIRDLKTYSEFIDNHHQHPHHDQPESQTTCPRPASIGAA
jgi:transposase